MEEKYVPDNEEKNENLDLLINIAREQNGEFVCRTQSLDTKIGFCLALYAAIIIYLFDFSFIKHVLSLKIYTVGEGVKLYSLVIITVVCILLTLVMVGIYIYALVSKNCKMFDAGLYQKDYYICKKEDLKENLLDEYRKNISYNYDMLLRKHKYFNVATYGTIVVLLLIVLSNYLKLYVG
ncbi:MAG: hypothetical protein N2749_01270 [Clostridia bacterium]|nr:hypothetical protein [Clostridia bacterium]